MNLDDVDWASGKSIKAYQEYLEKAVTDTLEKTLYSFLTDVRDDAVDALSAPMLVASARRIADPFAFTNVMKRWYQAVRDLEELRSDDLTRLGVDLTEVKNLMQESNIPSTAYDDVATLLHEAQSEDWTAYRTKRALSKLLIPKESSGKWDSRAKYRVAISNMARTVANETLGRQSNEGIQRRGFKYKMWLSHHDSRVRHTHLAAHGQTVPVGEMFQVGLARMLYPGYKFAPLGERINCRCTMKGINTVKKNALTASGNSKPETPSEDELENIANGNGKGDGDTNPNPDKDTADTPAENDALGVWQGVIVQEGLLTGDGRKIEPNALTWDTPLPLRIVESDVGAHDGAEVAGTIQTIERVEEGDGLYNIHATGTFDMHSEIGREAFRKVDDGLLNGVSVDLDDMSFEIRVDKTHIEELRRSQEESIEQSGEDSDDVVTHRQGSDDEVHLIKAARIRAATLVSIPAFKDAKIEIVELDDDDDDFDDALSRAVPEDTFAEDTDTETTEAEAEFNWVEEVGGLPRYIKRISDALQRRGMRESHAIATAVNTVKRWARGGGEVTAKTRAKAIKALAEWEAKRARAHLGKNSLTASGAPATDAPPNAWFLDPKLTEPTAIKVTEDGRVYGHLATWDSCHVGQPDYCVSPPASKSNYAYFHTGAVITREDHEVAVGHIVLGTTHASGEKGVTATMAHYDNTGLAVADVRAGEDQFGIWVSGALRPGLSSQDIRVLRSSPLSGDWRRVQGSLELVSALAVNMPGFPIPRPQGTTRDGDMYSLVASGMLAPRKVPRKNSENAFSEDDVKYLKSLLRKERTANVQRMAQKVTAKKAERVKLFAGKINAKNTKTKTKTSTPKEK